MARTQTLSRRPSIVDMLNGMLRKVPPWTLYILGAAWAAWLFWLGVTGGLGPEPITELEHRYGEIAINLLVVGLAVTPLRKYVGVNLLAFRRAIGVLCFFFVLAHLTVWAVLDVQTLGRVWADIVKRPYVTIGMLGFVLLLPLAVTSNNWSIRKMGGMAWRKLHKLVYPAAVLGALHYVWLAKGFQIEPILYMVVILGLVALRYLPASRSSRA